MQIDILTLFPNMFSGVLAESMLKRFAEQGLVTIKLYNFRQYATDKHKSVDDTPYGGGAGMVLRVDVLVTALEAILGRSVPSLKPNEKICLLSPKGPTFTQAMATEFAKLDRLVLICGHYEDVDARLLSFIDGAISIGDYVVTGGEIPAMVVIDAVTRLLPQALSDTALDHESFTQDPDQIEYPQFTKPVKFRGLPVPDVLLSGDHKKIADWKTAHLQKKT